MPDSDKVKAEKVTKAKAAVASKLIELVTSAADDIGKLTAPGEIEALLAAYNACEIAEREQEFAEARNLIVVDPERWTDNYKNMLWSLVEGTGVQGRSTMIWGLQQGSTAYMGAVKDGFREGQRSPWVRALFMACCTENEQRVYNEGRHIIGLPPV